MIIECSTGPSDYSISMDDIMGKNLLKTIGFPALDQGDIQPEQFRAVDRRLIELLGDEVFQKEIKTANSNEENMYLNRMAIRLNQVLVRFRHLIEYAEHTGGSIIWRNK